MTNDEIRTTLIWSIQRALLGAVPASLRAVTYGWEKDHLKLRFVFDGEIDPDDYEGAQIVGTEVISDLPHFDSIEEEIVRLDYPADVRESALEFWAYHRKERTTGGEPLERSRLTPSTR